MLIASKHFTMTAYLDFEFKDTPQTLATFDELPLWSAPFGLLLLKHIMLKRDMQVLDLGSGTGFPLLELTQRLGPGCKCYGIDSWVNANNVARQKKADYNISNVEIIDASAADLPFEDETIDLVVSNLGINNFEDPGKVFKACNRVLKKDGKLALTTNLNGHWQEFYQVFEQTLEQLGDKNAIEKLKTHQEHRGTAASVSALFTENNFKVTRQLQEKFEMWFLNGSALLNHHFVKLGWLSSWKDLVAPQQLHAVFAQLEENLNNYAERSGGLTLTVPMLFMEGEKNEP